MEDLSSLIVTADTDGARAFLAAYEADPQLNGVERAQVEAWLGALTRPRSRWVIRDEATRRTLTMNGHGDFEGTPNVRWRIDERVEDEELAVIVGPHSGVRYQIVRHRSAWCGSRTEAIIWQMRDVKGNGWGPGIALTKGMDQEQVIDLLRRADLSQAAEGKHVDAEGRVDVTAHRAPLSRADYERVSALLGLEALPDEGRDGVDSYGMRYGDFGYRTEAEARRKAQQVLAWRRQKAIEAERAAAASALPPAPEVAPVPRPWGAGGVRYDEACERCSRVSEVDNDTGLCQRCGGRA